MSGSILFLRCNSCRGGGGGVLPRFNRWKVGRDKVFQGVIDVRWIGIKIFEGVIDVRWEEGIEFFQGVIYVRWGGG